ncbi:NAD(P)/FAD-dependent oxidoreductase [Paenibacillaceae bacterium WGS1546]|uniref:NAD(P)/FAD-dependent oxidoreductase n=1 Tax=Cohnella sp. WGS1546 TaxID=3366810 RepID=UPI00372D285E
MKNEGMVIIGAGEAGARAAAELRAQGWQGALTLIGGERELPYERPPLSKQQLTEPEPSPVTIVGQERLRELDIRWIAGDPAVRIDRQAHEVELASGERIAYGRLLLATGARPRKLSVAGNAAEELLYLRTFGDALRLREKLRPGGRVAIIGGGFIGLEVAASAKTIGCEVTLVEAAPRILMRGVPPEIAERVKRRHLEAGVHLRIGVGIDRIEREGKLLAMKLADGKTVRSNTIVVGIGAVPETSLAEACGLELDNGVKVDERLATNDPNIFAAGDCCSFPHPRYGGRRIRLEAWRNAQDQGTHAAASMLGESQPFSDLPWFWSDQYDQTLQVAGLSDGSASTVVRDLGESGQLYFHLTDDGQIAAVSGVGPTGAYAKEFRLAELLIEQGARPEPSALANPSYRLKALLRA